MNERKYNHYIAWFNVNIKCLNVCEPAPAAHDYRISAPLDEVQQPSVVSRLKLTAHRRSAAAPVVTDEPEVIVIKKDGFVSNILKLSGKMVLHVIGVGNGCFCETGATLH